MGAVVAILLSRHYNLGIDSSPPHCRGSEERVVDAMDTLVSMASALGISLPPTKRTNFFSLPQELRDMMCGLALRRAHQLMDVTRRTPELKCKEPVRSQLYASYYSSNVFAILGSGWPPLMRSPRQRRIFRTHTSDPSRGLLYQKFLLVA